MCTYLKNMEEYKLKDLKLKEFDSILEMFDRAFKRNTKRAKVTVGWKIHKEGRKSYYQIMRADGKTQMYMIFSQMLKSFNRKDLYKLVKAKYESTRPVEDLDLILWGDLKTMFEPYIEDKVWKNQQEYKVLNWKLYDSCGVHSLMMQHVQIYMLVEKKYPLTPLTLSMMLEKNLLIDYESEMAYQLLKFIMKQLKKYTDILKHASRLIKAELPLSLRLIGVRMPHFSKDKSGVQFDPKQRTLLNFIKAEDNKKLIVNEEHSAYFRDGYEAHGCSHIDPSSDHLSELQQNICMSTDNIEEAVENHRSGVIRKALQDIKCKGKHASPVPETNTIIGSLSIISEHGSPVALMVGLPQTLSSNYGTSTHVVATCKYQKKVTSDLYKVVKARSGGHTVVQTEDDCSFSFGWNKHRQLEVELSPVQCLITDVRDVACGNDFTVWLTSLKGASISMKTTLRVF
ncbi:putative ribonuclease H-like domain-containing protein [Tanacetum coccineum]|uniref:Ribonuclease H-like domain-containing protein n=1 Tax=Tanacetum coccineum TaxID=301880 RepID=A0ABQ4Y1R3_9ASTR